MSILSVPFLLFLTGLIILYFALPKRFQWWVLLVFSLAFYALGGWLNLPFLLITACSVWSTTKKPVESVSTNTITRMPMTRSFGVKRKPRPLLLFPASGDCCSPSLL